MKRLVIFALTVCLAVAIFSGARNAMGYCQSTGYYTTDAEMLDAAIKSIILFERQQNAKMQIGKQVLSNKQFYEIERSVGAADLHAFKQNNRDCCAMRADSQSAPAGWLFILKKLMGNGAAYFSVIYSTGLKTSSSDIAPGKRKADFLFTNCGRFRGPVVEHDEVAFF
jgi:hypothetical protein